MIRQRSAAQGDAGLAWFGATRSGSTLLCWARLVAAGGAWRSEARLVSLRQGTARLGRRSCAMLVQYRPGISQGEAGMARLVSAGSGVTWQGRRGQAELSETRHRMTRFGEAGLARPGMVGQRIIRSVRVCSGKAGMASRGGVDLSRVQSGRGPARQRRLGAAWSGLARLGGCWSVQIVAALRMARRGRHGKVWHVAVLHGMARRRLARSVPARRCKAGLALPCEARLGAVRPVDAVLGETGKAGLGRVRLGPASKGSSLRCGVVQGRLGQAWRCCAGLGLAAVRLCRATQARHGLAWRCPAFPLLAIAWQRRLGSARLGSARLRAAHSRARQEERGLFWFGRLERSAAWRGRQGVAEHGRSRSVMAGCVETRCVKAMLGLARQACVWGGRTF